MSEAKSIGTALAVRGCRICAAWQDYSLLTSNYSLILAPPPRQRRYSPYKQGESAVRSVPHPDYHSAWVTLYSLLTTH